MVSPEPSLLQAEQPQLSQFFLIGEVFHPSDHFCGLPLDLLQQVYAFAVLETPELNAGLQVGSHQSRAEERRVTSLDLLAVILLMQTRIQLAFWARSTH